jgi:DNA polymerase eta
MAAKTFTVPIKYPQEMDKWFSILSVELHGRIMSMFEEYGTWPKNISVSMDAF